LDPTTNGSATDAAMSLIVPQLSRMKEAYAKLRIRVNNGNWLIMNRERITLLDTNNKILPLLEQPVSNLDLADICTFVNDHWRTLFAELGDGDVPPEKVLPIVLMPGTIFEPMLGAPPGFGTPMRGETLVTKSMCFVSVPALVAEQVLAAATCTHEVGHALGIRSNHEKPASYSVGSERYLLMTDDRYGISEIAPDKDGKHWRVQDGDLSTWRTKYGINDMITKTPWDFLTPISSGL
jgi:hypothetical protein